MEYKNKLIVLWLLTVVGMILHFNYHIGGIFYGIDIVKPGYDGKEPNSIFVIRNLFYHLPIVWILLIIYAAKSWAKLALFIISCLYFMAHASHLAGELTGDVKNPSQLSLLSLVFIVAALLVVEHFRFWRNAARDEKA